ncbi:MAG: ABC transporter permease [Nitrososphaerales archaeon]
MVALGTARVLAVRGATLFGVLIASLLLVIVVLGATGVSDRMMGAIVNEQVRELRQSLAQTIRDPDELERVVLAEREQLVEFYGLDNPWYFRLPDMVWRVLNLDLGSARTLKSFAGSTRVSDIVLERLPNTIILVTTAMGISAVMGLYIGVKLATRVGSRLDRGMSYISAASYALPTWWVGILFILVLSFQLHIFPFGGIVSAPAPTGLLNRTLDIIWHASLPVATLVLASVGSWAYVVRTMVLNTAQEDFVMAARAKGLPENIVMRRHIIRVAAPPIVTSLVLGLTASFGGAILTETVFNWPGMGRLYFDAILSLDENVVVALTFMFTVLYVGARFILEVLYILLDPRVRY